MIQKSFDYRLILSLAQQSTYGRELARLIDGSQPTIARRLQALEQEGIITSKQQGKNKIYILQQNLAARHALARAEHAKTQAFLKSHPREAVLFEKLCRQTSASMVVLFGSYAKGKERKGSDYDLYLDIKRKERDTLMVLHRKLRIQAGRFEPSRALAQEVIRNHIILKGIDAFLALTRPETKRQATT